MTRASHGAPASLRRVLIAGQAPPLVGGIASFVDSLSSALSDVPGLDVDVLDLQPAAATRLGSLTARNVVTSLRHASRLRRRSRGSDVVHLNLACAPTLPLLRALMCVLAARRADRVVLHAHTGAMTACARRRTYRAVLRRLLRLDVHVAACSPDDYRTLRALGGRVNFIPNAVDPATIPTARKQEPPLVLYVGTVAPEKGLLDLGEALRLVRRREPGAGFRMVVCGDARQAGPGVFESVRDWYGATGLDDVTFTGAVPRAQALRLMAQASILCLPSYSEGGPIVVLEAMAAGAVVVASAVGDVPAFLDHGRAGVLVEPGDVDGLAAALADLVSRPELRADYAARATEHVRQHYSMNALVMRVLDLYERAPSRRGAGSPALSPVPR